MEPPIRTDTIVAVATPAGVGAIGIVRLSGEAAISLFAKVWKNGQHSVDKFVNKRIYYGKIIDLSTAEPEKALDDVLVAYFQKPHSYTGEDVVEIFAHGNPYLLERIVQQLVKAGARPAAPGEFTLRAFLHGRIDLAQAEAVADLIAATGEKAHRAATEQLQGRLSAEVQRQLRALTDLRAFVEATIDFPEDDVAMLDRARIGDRLGAMETALARMAATYQEGRLYREGLRVVLLGCPNAGKSSLFNALLGEARAIVHDRPGTTRDVIEAAACLGGVTVRLIDTAGLRPLGGLPGDGAGDIEALGMERTHQQLGAADLLLLVIDGSVPFVGAEREFLPDTMHDRLLVVLNKRDLPQVADHPAIAAAFPGVPTVAISARSGDGLAELPPALLARGGVRAAGDGEGVLITNVRHKEALDVALEALAAGRQAVAAGRAAEFVAEDLRQASDALGQIVGTVTTDDLLTQIFAKFCIGK